MSKQKGFVGPIGDDLPSLVPLIFSLIIFFASFTSAFDVFIKSKEQFDSAVLITDIAASIAGDHFIVSPEEFYRSCERVSVPGLFYKAGLVELEEDFRYLDIRKFVNENEGAYAVGTDVLACPLNIDPDAKLREHSDVTVLFFPVIFQDPSVVSGLASRPMLLVVVVWR
ncbi:MAG: hypothetical protein J7J87_00075 [Candidatus Diapherotrites archaeon]|nr:hypothetical protein [Candidatus Diapherotrites archaeon]